MITLLLKALMVAGIALLFGRNPGGVFLVAIIAAFFVFNPEIKRLSGTDKLVSRPEPGKHPLETRE